MSRIDASNDISQVKPEDVAQFVDVFLQQVSDAINGNLDFMTNFNCKLISVTFGAPDTNVATNHGLGRVPAGYIITGASVATSVYDGSVGNTASVINLRANVPATVGLLVY